MEGKRRRWKDVQYDGKRVLWVNEGDVEDWAGVE
jgi:hypothetical protein